MARRPRYRTSLSDPVRGVPRVPALSQIVGAEVDAEAITGTVDELALIDGVPETLTLRVAPPAAPGVLALAFSVPSLSLVQGTSDFIGVTITRPPGFSGAVTVALTGLPSGVASSPVTIPSGQTTGVVSLVVGSSAALGLKTVTGTATGSGAASGTATLALTITAGTAPGTNGPGEMLYYPVSTRLLRWTPPTGIDQYGNGTVYDTDAALAALPTTWKFVATDYAGDLQAAVNAAQRGWGLVMENGAVWTGTLSLPAKTGTGYVRIVSRAEYNRLLGLANPFAKGPKRRVTAADAAQMCVIQGPATGNAPAIQTAQVDAPGFYLFSCCEMRLNPANTAVNYQSFFMQAVCSFTDDRDGVPLSARPHDIILDRCWIHGHPDKQLARCVWANALRIAVLDSLLQDAHSYQKESIGIGGHSGTEKIKIVNVRIEAATQGIFFGGADPKLSYQGQPGGNPCDIEIRHTYLTKPLIWNHRHPSYGGKRWTVKNGMEFKNVERYLVEGVQIENVWQESQKGMGFLDTNLSDNNSNHRDNTITDGHFRHSRIHYCVGGFETSARNEYASASTRVILAGTPAVVQYTGHPFRTGEQVYVFLDPATMNGLTGLVPGTHTVTKIDDNSFSLDGTSVTGTTTQIPKDGTHATATPNVFPKLVHAATRLHRDNILMTDLAKDVYTGAASAFRFEVYNDLTYVVTENITDGLADGLSGVLGGASLLFSKAAAGKAGAGMEYRNILMAGGSYGWRQDEGGSGASAINGYHTVTPTVQGVVLYQETSGASYAPHGVTKLSTRDAVGFVNPSLNNWRLLPGSFGATHGVGGGPTGCDHDLLDAYLAGVVD